MKKIKSEIEKIAEDYVNKHYPLFTEKLKDILKSVFIAGSKYEVS